METVELHPTRTTFVNGTFLLVAGPVMAAYGLLVEAPVVTRVFALGFAVLSVLAGLYVLRSRRSAPRFRVDGDGLTLRLPVHGIDRLVPWTEIHSIILEEPESAGNDRHPLAPRLVLVPTMASPLRETAIRSSATGDRFELLDLGEVKEAPDEVAGALARLSGGRFVDARAGMAAAEAAREAEEEAESPEFLIVMRGYDMGVVNELVRIGEHAVATGGRFERMTAKSRIDATTPPVTVRGYDRGQVDQYLEKLTDRLSH